MKGEVSNKGNSVTLFSSLKVNVSSTSRFPDFERNKSWIAQPFVVQLLSFYWRLFSCNNFLACLFLIYFPSDFYTILRRNTDSKNLYVFEIFYQPNTKNLWYSKWTKSSWKIEIMLWVKCEVVFKLKNISNRVVLNGSLSLKTPKLLFSFPLVFKSLRDASWYALWMYVRAWNQNSIR